MPGIIHMSDPALIAVVMEELPGMSEEESDWENDYGVLFVPPHPTQPANPAQHLVNVFWVGADSDEEDSDEEAGPVNDEIQSPANPEGLGEIWVGDALNHEPAELSAANIDGMATELGIANHDAFMRFTLDEHIVSTVSWLVQKDLGNEIDLVDFPGWFLARRCFLIGRHNAEEMFGLRYTRARPANVTDFTAAAISWAFELMEYRRRELGIDGWGTLSLKWRVCYGVLQIYLSAGVDMAHDLATREVREENWTPAKGARMEVRFGAVRAYAEMMREEKEYDPGVVRN